nr:integrase, catalytic region, zinc finger, CCHC-type, peptidase aspartic, catalytic [Tanacetum cinerariifolium]
SFIRKDFSKSTSVTKNNVSNDFSKPVPAQTLPATKKPCLKNTYMLAPGMYKIRTAHTQSTTSKLPQDSKRTNISVSFSTGVISTTSVSRPQLKSNPKGDRVLRSNSGGKKLEILLANKKSILKNTNVLNLGMYKIYTDHTQTRTSKLPSDSRKTNKRVTFSTGVIPSTSVSRPQLKSNPIEDRVLRNNSRGKKQDVEDHRRSVKLSKNKMSVTACNDSLNAKTLNVKSVSAIYDKYVLHDKHDMCVLKSVAKPIKRTSTPSGYIWKPKSRTENVIPNLVKIILFIIDSGCSKYMTGNLKLLINFVAKFLGTVKSENDQIAPILGYGDPVQGAITIKKVYYVEGLNHNLFSVGQFRNADLEVAFRKSMCFIRDLKGNDLLSGSRETDLYSITLQNTNSPNPIYLVAKATSSQAWLWHRRLSHLNFDTINLLSKNDIVVGLPKLKFVKDHLCSSCELGKAKRKDGENLDKMKEKGDECIFVGYSNQSKAYRVFNKRTRVIMESIHVDFDELPLMTDGENLDKMKEKGDECIFVGYSTQSRAYRVFNKRTRVIMEAIHFKPAIQRQANVPQADKTVTTSNELDFLFSLMFDELLNGSSKVVSKSSVVSAADAPYQHKQYTTPLNNHTTPAPTCQALTLVPTVISSKNINQAETYAKNDQVADDEFINIFTTPTKDHPLEQVIGNPSQSVRTRCQLESDAEMCMFTLTEELYQFDRLDVWELVDRPLYTNVIYLKWLWKNKSDEENIVIRNKSRLVAKGYAQKEGVNFEESFG